MNFVLTSPNHLSKDTQDTYGHKIFLAGGISNCPDWQSEMINQITQRTTNVLLINPRDPNFNPKATAQDVANQVEWEYHYINDVSDLLLFWFPKETVCPITLYELGKATQTHQNIIVGADPSYPRHSTLVAQLKLERPDIKIHNSLEEVVEAIVEQISPIPKVKQNREKIEKK